MAGEGTISIISSIVPIITAGIAIGGTTWVVNFWQKRKDISETRKEVIKNFISFKNQVVLMDNFVGELLIMFANFGNSVPTREHRLSDLLPWHYSYADLGYYSNEMNYDNLKDFKDENITPEQIKERIKILQECTEYYIDFQVDNPPLKKFGLQFDEFKKKFYIANSHLSLLSANLYYPASSKILLKNFSGMWEYMMACYILINRIMNTTNENDFIETIKKYKESEAHLFYFIEWIENKLVREKIMI